MKNKTLWNSGRFILGICSHCQKEFSIRDEDGCLQRLMKHPHICGACGDLPVEGSIFEHILHVHGFDIRTGKAVTKRGNIDRDWHLDKEELK